MKRLKTAIIFGTRPDAVKMAPLAKAISQDPEMEAVVISTGQHRQMLDQVLKIFDIEPHFDLDVMRENQSLEHITVKILETISPVFDKVKPDIALVHGDTATCFVAGLAAFYRKIPVGHVEAGLRTFNKYYPFPEEMNRKLACALTDCHFAPTRLNRANLEAEGVKADKIFVTGNTVIDAMRLTVKPEYTFKADKLQGRHFDPSKRFILVEAHRRENLGKPMEGICRALKRLVADHADISMVFSVHMNPSVRQTVQGILSGEPRIHLIEPVDVSEWHNLIGRCHFVMTDSGGMQEEAPSLGKPVLVLRNETERPEAVAAGTVILAGTDEDNIYEAASRLLNDGDAYMKMAKSVNPYGDGHASERIIRALKYEFGMTASRPAEFSL